MTMLGNVLGLVAMLLVTFRFGATSWSIVAFALLALAFLSVPGQLFKRLGSSVLDDVGDVVARISIAYLLVSAFVVITNSGEMGMLLGAAALAPPMLLTGRALTHALGKALRRHKDIRERVLVVGGGRVAQQVIATLRAREEYGLKIVGVVDDDPLLDPERLGAQVIGGIADIPHLVRSQDISGLIVAFSRQSGRNTVDVLRTAMSCDITTWVVPRFFELGHEVKRTGEQLWGLPVLRLHQPARKRSEWMVKRALDFAMAGALLLILLPLIAVISILVYLDLGRPVFYRQVRVGVDNVPFTLLKFRSMRDEETPVQGREWAARAERTTRLGRILRTTSLDELPQLINVLRGDMSLVGPRPERPYFASLFEEEFPGYSARHRLPGGITGWAQIHGLCGDTSIEERLAFDNYYIENWSLGEDLKILVRTFRTMTKKFKWEAAHLKAEGRLALAERRKQEARAAERLAESKATKARQGVASSEGEGLNVESQNLAVQAEELEAQAMQFETQGQSLETTAEKLQAELEKEAQELKIEVESEDQVPLN